MFWVVISQTKKDILLRHMLYVSVDFKCKTLNTLIRSMLGSLIIILVFTAHSVDNDHISAHLESIPTI